MSVYLYLLKLFLMLVDILVSLLSFILVIIGVVGSLLPALPGPQLSYIAILLIHFVLGDIFSAWFLITRGLVVIGVLVIDYFVPMRGTKRYGGTKWGSRGSMVGLILGTLVLPFFGISFGPFGLISIIGGPFLGAYVGEILHFNDSKKALRSARGSFIGFIAGTFIKIFVAVWLGIVAIIEIVQYFF